MNAVASTIYALATGGGKSALAIVRISGPAVLNVARALCGRELAPRRAELVTVRDPETGRELDRGLAILFLGPASFTGEDSLEFQLHGGRAVMHAVLQVLGDFRGLRPANPGEFTRRAYANGKLDLNSAEGLADLIDADTEVQRKQALRQLKGATTDLSDQWRSQLIDLRALVESHLDFSDQEDVPQDGASAILDALDQLARGFASALLNAALAERVRDGFVVVLAGPPNAGKSTLLNALVRRDVALVSEHPGTTRDVIEVTMDLNGLPVILMDTAGIRQTEDHLEAAGIARTLDRAGRADLVVWLHTPIDETTDDIPNFPGPVIRVRSKTDIYPLACDEHGISALTGIGIPEFLEMIRREAEMSLGSNEPLAMLNARQRQFVSDARLSVASARAHVLSGAVELAAEELASASRGIESLTERTSVDDVLDAIFSRFCIGK